MPPRTLPLLPDRHRPSSDHYSKSEKTKKTLPYPSQSRTHLPLIVFSTLCLIVGVAGIAFSLLSLLSPKPIPTFRCGRVEDTFRSLPDHRRVGDGGAVAGGFSDRPKLVGFVGIQTGFSSVDRRKALRSTWFPSDHEGLLSVVLWITNSDTNKFSWFSAAYFFGLSLLSSYLEDNFCSNWLQQATGLAFRFVIGRSKDAKKMAVLEKEIEKYNDFMIIDVEEEYLKLPYKTLAFFKAAFELFEADYYVKADDDIYLRPDRLATLLAKERTHPMTYIGCMKKGPVITDPKLKWFEKSGHLIGNEYFLHAYGPIYVLSAEVVASLAVARNTSSNIEFGSGIMFRDISITMN